MVLNKKLKKKKQEKEPRMATPGLAGCDLFAAENKIIKPV